MKHYFIDTEKDHNKILLDLCLLDDDDDWVLYQSQENKYHGLLDTIDDIYLDYVKN